MTDRYHGPRYHRIEARRVFDGLVLAALTERLLVDGGRPFATSWSVVDQLKAAAPAGNVVTAVSARAVGESLKRLERAGCVERVHLVRRYKTVPDKPRPYPGWRLVAR